MSSFPQHLHRQPDKAAVHYRQEYSFPDNLQCNVRTAITPGRVKICYEGSSTRPLSGESLIIRASLPVTIRRCCQRSTCRWDQECSLWMWCPKSCGRCGCQHYWPRNVFKVTPVDILAPKRVACEAYLEICPCCLFSVIFVNNRAVNCYGL